MAENEDGQERTEEPTTKRLDDARRKGQVPRSRELNTLTMLMLGALTFLVIGETMIDQFYELMHTGLSFERRDVFNTSALFNAMKVALTTGLTIVLPFLLVSLVAAIASSVALGGISFSLEAMAPKLSKLDPIKGLGRLLGVKGLVELGKALGKLLLVTIVALILFNLFFDEILYLGRQTPKQAMANGAEILLWCFLFLSLGLIFVAAIDVPFQLWDHKRQLKMTKQEVKDEMKDTEGKPEVKKRIKQAQYEIASRRMMEAVPEADVVITNPTHFAVALKYDDSAMRAPRVVAKGRGLVAAEIRTRALEHNVALFQAAPLARALYFSTDLDQEIPAGLYYAVAQVLAYVFQLRTATTYGGVKPPTPGDIEVPDEYYHPPAD
jgi:flagellar biosynthetic protein FlhB